jgi:hypothetical protein
VIGPLGHDPHEVLGELGPEPDRHTRNPRRGVREAFVQARFAHPESPQKDGGAMRARGEQPVEKGEYLARHHPLHLRGHPRQEEEVLVSPAHSKSGRRPDGIREHHRTDRKKGLVAVVLAHGVAHPIEEGLDPGQHLLVEYSLHAEEPGRALARYVVPRRPEASRDDHHPRARFRLTKGLKDLPGVVRHRRVAHDAPARVAQLGGHKGGIGVHDLAIQNFVPDGDDLRRKALHREIRDQGETRNCATIRRQTFAYKPAATSSRTTA